MLGNSTVYTDGRLGWCQSSGRRGAEHARLGWCLEVPSLPPQMTYSIHMAGAKPSKRA